MSYNNSYLAKLKEWAEALKSLAHSPGLSQQMCLMRATDIHKLPPLVLDTFARKRRHLAFAWPAPSVKS